MKTQAKPKRGRAAVTSEVIKDLKARRILGKQKYGRVLETHNGREALLDLYEEILDAAQYLKQHLMEMESK